MDGNIWVESQEGAGSGFIFEVPLLQADKTKVNLHSTASEISYKATKKKEDISTLKESKLEPLHVEIEELFSELLRALQTSQPLKCKPIMKEIDKYQLSEEREGIFKRVQILFRDYNFKEAIELLRRDNV